MPYIKLQGFSGIVPKTGPTLLADNQAQVAKNLKIQSGELRPWRTPALEYTPTTNTVQSVYKFSGPSGTTPKWLEFTDNVDVVAGPVADTSEYRLYYTSDVNPPRKTNWLLATGNNGGVAPFPNAYYEMGVPAPTAAALASAAGTGDAPVETRSYIYTHVTEFGTVAEESAPSPAVTVTANFSGDAVTISSFATPPTGNYNFKYRRIYRTVAGNASTTYQLVAEIPIAQPQYVDTKSVVELGQVIPSLYFTPPPSGLQGIVSMPNGMLAGFTGNQIWFCEPYLPHAWPSNYMLTTEYPIVGLGVFGNSLFVGTTKNPYIITGSSPTAMSQEKLSIVQPCVSKKSVVCDQFGVIYASPNGMVAIGPGAQDVVTGALFSRDEWQEINPSSIIGAVYNNMYFGFYKVGSVYNTFILQRNDNPPLVNFDFAAKALFVEPTTGYLFGLSSDDNKVYKLDGGSTLGNYTWRSKIFQSPLPTNFGVLQVHANYDQLATVTGAYINIKIYADGVLKSNQNITSPSPVRLPAGYKGYNWEIEVTGNIHVRTVAIASTVEEIKGQ